MRFLWFFLMVCMLLITCTKVDYKPDTHKPQFYHKTVKNLTDIIVHDIFSPPVASRVYAYPSIAAYEAIIQGHPSQKSLAGQLRDLTNIPQPNKDSEYDFAVSALRAFNVVGKALIFSEDRVESYEESLYKELKESGIPGSVFKRSVEYGDQVAQHILEWAEQDNYKETRSFPKYSISDDPSKWQPTPPAYMDGIEPSWNKIRPFTLNSAEQFPPKPPTEFNMTPGSKFYEETMEVYNTVKNAGAEETEIASFWDCNPYVMNVTGHVMFASKKITPGGHWIGITRIACEKDSADFMQTVEAYTLTSIALADAFISCWDEKYRSNLVRPETVINQHIDENWVPILQTPPFPEHTSGHSVISTAAAISLTHLFGEDFDFEDDVEVEYGLPIRTFDSFLDASSEAAISRLYGGIHYMPAIDYGVEQGTKVGNWVIRNIQLRSS